LQQTDIAAIIDSTILDIQKKYQRIRPEVIVRLVPSSNLVTANSLKIYCDGPKIAQALFNLLDNAMRFTERGSVEVGLSEEGSEMMFTIRDSGTGIDPLIKDRLFEKFVAKSNGGTGLGLYLCRKIIEAHRGRIWAQNNTGIPGATFTFTLPSNLTPSEFTADQASSSSTSTTTETATTMTTA
jgi:signal transduction histidine kinase